MARWHAIEATASFGDAPTGLALPTRSVLLVFTAPSGEDVMLGCTLERASGQPAGVSSDGVVVAARFWAVEASTYAVPGARFNMWYGRIIGHGAVLRLLDDSWCG